MPSPNLYRVFKGHVLTISGLHPHLPISVPLAKADSRIVDIWKKVPTGTTAEVYEVFNRRFELVFGQNHDLPPGQLPNFERGKNGLDMVVRYLSLLVKNNEHNVDFQWAAAMPRVLRLKNEYQHYVYVPSKLSIASELF